MKSIMKLFLAAIAIFLIFSLLGCSNATNNEENSPSVSKTEHSFDFYKMNVNSSSGVTGGIPSVYMEDLKDYILDELSKKDPAARPKVVIIQNLEPGSYCQVSFFDNDFLNQLNFDYFDGFKASLIFDDSFNEEQIVDYFEKFIKTNEGCENLNHSISFTPDGFTILELS